MHAKVSKALESSICDWVKYLSNLKKFSKHSIKAYITDLYYFLQFMNSHLGEELTLDVLANLKLQDFRAWFSYNLSSGSKDVSNARKLSAIKNFYLYLKKFHNIKNNELRLIRLKVKNHSLPKALTIESALDMIEAIDLSNWIGYRDKAILMLLYGAGLRISEALSITPANLASNDHAVMIKGKGGKEALIHLLPKVFDALVEYIKVCPFSLDLDQSIFKGVRGGNLCQSVYRLQLSNLRRILNLPEYATPHAFRHSFATHLLKHGDIRIVQELLRHKSIQTTQRYTKVVQSEMIASYLKSHPLTKK